MPEIGLGVADALLADAVHLSSESRRVESVLALAEMLEVVLARCASSVLMPAAAKRSTPAEIQMLRKRYMHAVGGLPCGALRNVVVNLMTRQIRPATVPEALDVIEHAKRFAEVLPAQEQIATIQDADARAAVERLRDTPLLDLRAAVIHQGHDPTDRELREHRDSTARLARALVVLFRLADSSFRAP